MRFWFDTEFIEDGKTIDLMSIGVVREDGEQYYAEVIECDLFRASPWVRQNVIPHLRGGIDRLVRADIALDLIKFMGEKPEIWAYYADYDWVALCQLFGTMMDLPKGWPMYCRDVKQLCDSLGNLTLPAQTSQEHNALADAVWTKCAWEFLNAPPPQVDSGREEIAVPKAALDWLFGEGTDAKGKWFSDNEEEVTPLANRYKPKFWWRSKFREMIPALRPERSGRRE